MQRTNERFVERLPLVLRRPLYAYVVSALFCGVAFVLRLTAQGFLPIGYPFVSFFPAVILSTFLFGLRPGIFAGIVCGILSWYFFIPASAGGVGVGVRNSGNGVLVGRTKGSSTTASASLMLVATGTGVGLAFKPACAAVFDPDERTK